MVYVYIVKKGILFSFSFKKFDRWSLLSTQTIRQMLPNFFFADFHRAVAAVLPSFTELLPTNTDSTPSPLIDSIDVLFMFKIHLMHNK